VVSVSIVLIVATVDQVEALRFIMVQFLVPEPGDKVLVEELLVGTLRYSTDLEAVAVEPALVDMPDLATV
jgi:hypothetical protein